MANDSEGRARVAGLRVADDLRIELIATSPQLQSPVAICVDGSNRIYAAEVHRFNRGTEENRNRTFLLEEDLRNQTTDDRLQSYRKYIDQFGGSMDYFTRYSDRVVRLVDRDGDGRVDESTVFADDFRNPLSGIGAGLIARDGVVWYTNIPDLWRLEDRDDDGVAERRTSLVSGFGVQNAFLGHDLHGLAWGPDGKLYFSVGDRGFHVETSGGVFHGPRMGAIFRCNPDGSDFEVVFTGLRNPQELAFDDWGNLFTADNNCDKGDYGRLVYAIEGGSAGWNMAYQTLVEPYLTGPWHAEGIWHVPSAYASHSDPLAAAANPHTAVLAINRNSQPAWIVPPVAAIGTGPGGLVCHPGVGPLRRLAGKLMMCNFTGNGGLEAFTLQAAGAGFRLEGVEDVCKPIMATDVAFTFDGRMLLSDYVQVNWDGSSGGGRIYSLAEREPPAAFAELAELASQSFASLPDDRLVSLLAYDDRRIRQRAQSALVDRGPAGAVQMAEVVCDLDAPTFARLHALWGLGQLGCDVGEPWNAVREALDDKDDRLRAQAARVCGWAADRGSQEKLIALLRTESPRVQLMAAEALGKIGDRKCIEPLYDLLSSNADRDPLIRHAAVYALSRLSAADEAVAKTDSPDRAQRLASVVVLRHMADARVARYLADADMVVATEAARTINDLPLESATLQLARWRPPSDWDVAEIPEALWRRVINACFRLGDREFARRVAEIAADPRVSEAVRREALTALIDWARGENRDRVTGFWRPVAPRDPAIVRTHLGTDVAKLPDEVPQSLRSRAIELLSRWRIDVPLESLGKWLDVETQTGETRAAAARLLSAVESPHVAVLLRMAIRDPEPTVRIAAREMLLRRQPEAANQLLRDVILEDGSATVGERQAAMALLRVAPPIQAAEVLAKAFDRLQAGDWPVPLTLDLLTAVEAFPELRGRAEDYRIEQAGLPESERSQFLAEGGDAERGRWIFFNHTAAQCVRCHQIGLDGGIAGPRLDGVASRHTDQTRAFLLESMRDPSAKFATGFEQTTVLTADGRIITGTVSAESEEWLTIVQADGRAVEIESVDIEDRTRGQSPMPSMRDVLNEREQRDLVEFLSSLR